MAEKCDHYNNHVGTPPYAIVTHGCSTISFTHLKFRAERITVFRTIYALHTVLRKSLFQSMLQIICSQVFLWACLHDFGCSTERWITLSFCDLSLGEQMKLQRTESSSDILDLEQGSMNQEPNSGAPIGHKCGIYVQQNCNQGQKSVNAMSIETDVWQ